MFLHELLHPALIQPVDAQQVLVLVPTTRGPRPASMAPETIIGCTECCGRVDTELHIKIEARCVKLECFQC